MVLPFQENGSEGGGRPCGANTSLYVCSKLLKYEKIQVGILSPPVIAFFFPFAEKRLWDFAFITTVLL
jgi:hypothetical protein